MMNQGTLLIITLSLNVVSGFVPSVPHVVGKSLFQSADSEAWTGDVVSNNKGTIQGCTLKQVEGSSTAWEICIDGVEADLGKFSEIVYKKLLTDAKSQRFQGFRPGTVPPHLLSTYKAFCMDEVARETTLEAMQQNNVKPFDGAREEFVFVDFSIPPPIQKKKKVGGKRTDTEGVSEEVTEPTWRSYSTMKEAINIGKWTPGQSFSFVAKEVKGQKLTDTVSNFINPLAG